jgi:hypothetical protein
MQKILKCEYAFYSRHIILPGSVEGKGEGKSVQQGRKDNDKDLERTRHDIHLSYTRVGQRGL